MAFLGTVGVRIGQREAYEPALRPAGMLDFYRPLADKERLALADRPAHRRLIGMGQAIGILTDDDMPLLEPHHALRLDPERLDAEGCARGRQRVPERFAQARRRVDLVAELADEADPEHARR